MSGHSHFECVDICAGFSEHGGCEYFRDQREEVKIFSGIEIFPSEKKPL